jgi:SAM-dependent methyltransferase
MKPRGVRAAIRRKVVGAAANRELARLLPVSHDYGFDRGTPVDRHYIQRYIARHAGRGDYADGDIRGRVLEFGTDHYTREFGQFSSPTGRGIVESVDIVDIAERNSRASIRGDITLDGVLPSASFDCIICTQVLHLLFDQDAAISHLHRALDVGGVLLVTVPGISRRCQPDASSLGDFWRYTSAALSGILMREFDATHVSVEAFGNVRTAAAFLYGFAAEELSQAERELSDPNFEVVVAARAVKQ